MEGFTSSYIREHREIILEYIKEVRDRGLLDDRQTTQKEKQEAPQHELGDNPSFEEIQQAVDEGPSSKQKGKVKSTADHAEVVSLSGSSFSTLPT